MKINNLIIVIILLITSSLIHSQFKITYGVKVGAVSAHQTQIFKRSEYAYSSKWGIGGGVFLEGSFNNSISILGELDYLQEGWRDDVLDKRYSVNVLSAPVMLALKTHAGKFVPYLLLGPRFDFLLSIDSVENSFDKSNDPIIGITLGAGFERVVWKNYSFLAEIRYNYDFESIFRVSSVGGLGSSYYSRSLGFLVGVKF